jgi:hypothetical protein
VEHRHCIDTSLQFASVGGTKYGGTKKAISFSTVVQRLPCFRPELIHRYLSTVQEKVLSLTTQALVKVQMRLNQSVTSDYLTVFKLEREWRFVSKTYYRVELT